MIAVAASRSPADCTGDGRFQGNVLKVREHTSQAFTNTEVAGMLTCGVVPCVVPGPLQSPFWAGGLALFALLLALRGQWAVLLQWGLVMGTLVAACLLGEAEPAADKQPNLALLAGLVRSARGGSPG